MTLLEETCAAVAPVDEVAARRAQARMDGKTKPRRSLGRLEELACQAAAVYRRPDPALPGKAIVVMAGDHGVAVEAVSAYPQEVTVQMLASFVAGRAAINVLARQAGARVLVVDMGTCNMDIIPGVLDRRVGRGTVSFFRGDPAMTREQAVAGIETGIRLAEQLHTEGVGLLGTGEMGIGNTTAASALTAALTVSPVTEVTGRGTGIDERRWGRKVALIELSLAAHRPDPADPVGVLACVGGFEIAGLVGLILGAAAHGMLVLLDGFITGAAALLAARLCPRVQPYLIASHRSVEPGHRIQLEALALRPLLDLELRLGEGTGAALAMPLLEAALRLLAEMATFEAAGVSDTGA